jgi:DNA-directed RNA polymerase specialized sigma24 family protein
MTITETGNDNLFESFIDRYSPPIYSAMAKLTGVTDEKELETLTINVFVEIWNNSEELLREIPPTAFIYKMVLQHVFSYLKKEGREDQILLLRNTLLIDPSYYRSIIEPPPASH